MKGGMAIFRVGSVAKNAPPLHTYSMSNNMQQCILKDYE
jgi:hypothetical protein